MWKVSRLCIQSRLSSTSSGLRLRGSGLRSRTADSVIPAILPVYTTYSFFCVSLETQTHVVVNSIVCTPLIVEGCSHFVTTIFLALSRLFPPLSVIYRHLPSPVNCVIAVKVVCFDRLS